MQTKSLLVCVLLFLKLTTFCIAQQYQVTPSSSVMTSCGSTVDFTLNLTGATTSGTYTFAIESAAPGMYVEQITNLSNVTLAPAGLSTDHKTFDFTISASTASFTVSLFAGYCNEFPSQQNSIQVNNPFRLEWNASPLSLTGNPSITVNQGAQLSFNSSSSNIVLDGSELVNDEGVFEYAFTSAGAISFNGYVEFKESLIGYPFDIRSIEFYKVSSGGVETLIGDAILNPVTNTIPNQNDNTFATVNYLFPRLNASPTVPIAVTLGVNEKILIKEKVKLNGCMSTDINQNDNIDFLKSHPQIRWGCKNYDLSCGSPDQNVDATFGNQDPDLVIIDDHSYPDLFCYNTPSGGLERYVIYENQGNVTAKNIRVKMDYGLAYTGTLVPRSGLKVYILDANGNLVKDISSLLNLGKYDLDQTTDYFCNYNTSDPADDVTNLPNQLKHYRYAKQSGSTTQNVMEDGQSYSGVFLSRMFHNNGVEFNFVYPYDQHQPQFGLSPSFESCLPANEKIVKKIILDEYIDNGNTYSIDLEPGQQLKIQWQEYNCCQKLDYAQVNQYRSLTGPSVAIKFDNNCLEQGLTSEEYKLAYMKKDYLPNSQYIKRFVNSRVDVQMAQVLRPYRTLTQGDVDFCLDTKDGYIDKISSSFTTTFTDHSSTAFTNNVSITNTKLKVRFYIKKGLDIDLSLQKAFDFGWITDYNGYNTINLNDFNEATGCSGSSCTGGCNLNDELSSGTYHIRLYNNPSNPIPLQSLSLLRSADVPDAPTFPELKFYNSSGTAHYASLLYEATYSMQDVLDIVNQNPVPNDTRSDLKKVMDYLAGCQFDFYIRSHCGEPLSAFKTVFYIDQCATSGTCSSNANTTMLPLGGDFGAVTINCPGCKVPGGNVSLTKTYRDLNMLGYVDADNNGIPDNNQKITTSHPSAQLVTYGDVLYDEVPVFMSEGESNSHSGNYNYVDIATDNSKDNFFCLNSDLTANSFYLNTLYIKIAKHDNIDIATATASINGSADMTLTKFDYTGYSILRLTIAQYNAIHSPSATHFDVSHRISLKIKYEIGDLGNMRDIMRLNYLAGYSNCDDCEDMGEFIIVDGNLKKLVNYSQNGWPRDYIYLEDLVDPANNINALFICTQGESSFGFIPYKRYSNSGLTDPDKCSKVINVNETGMFFKDNSALLTDLPNGFEGEARIFLNQHKYVAYIPTGYEVSDLRLYDRHYISGGIQNVNHSWQTGPIALSTPVNGPNFTVTLTPYSNSTYPEYGAKLEIEITPSLPPVNDVNYNQSDYIGKKEYIPEQLATALPVMMFDEHFELGIGITINPTSCTTIPLNLPIAYFDGSGNMLLGPTASIYDFEKRDNALLRPLTSNPHTALTFANQYAAYSSTTAMSYFMKPPAVISAFLTNSSNYAINEQYLQVPITVNNELTPDGKTYNAEYPFLYLNGSAFPQGLTLKGVYRGTVRPASDIPTITYFSQETDGTQYLVELTNNDNHPILKYDVSTYNYVLVFEYDCSASGCADNLIFNNCSDNAPRCLSATSPNVNIVAGFNCNDYPTLSQYLANQICFKTNNIPLSIQNALVQFSRDVYIDGVLVENNGPLNITPCDNFTYNIEVASGCNGLINGFEIQLDLPAGYTVNTYPSTQVINPNQTNPPIKFDYNATLSDPVNHKFVYIKSSDSPGLLQGNNLIFEFDLQAPCQVSNGQALGSEIVALSYCGKPSQPFIISNPTQNVLPSTATPDDIIVTASDITADASNNLTVNYTLPATTQYENELIVKVTKGNFTYTYNCTIPDGTAAGTYSFFGAGNCNTSSVVLSGNCGDFNLVDVRVIKRYDISCNSEPACENVLPETSIITKNVMVSGSLYPVLSVSGNGVNFLCGTNNSVTLSTDPGYVSYTWYKDGVQVSGPSSSNTHNATDGGYYYVHVEASNGCTGNSQTIHVIDQVEVTAFGDICEYEDPGLTVSINGALVPYDVFWIKNGQHISSINNEKEGIYMAEIVITTIPGCTLTTAPMEIMLKESPAPYTISVLPPHTPTGNVVVICPNEQVTLEANAPGSTPVPITGYAWNSNYPSVPNDPQHIVSGNDYVTITTMGDNGCHSESAGISVYTPHVSIGTICTEGNTTGLQAGINIPGTVVYEWTLPDNSTVQGQSISVTTSGTYYVEAINLSCSVGAFFCLDLSGTEPACENKIENGNFEQASYDCGSDPAASAIANGFASELTCMSTVPPNCGTPGHVTVTNHSSGWNLCGQWVSTSGFYDAANPTQDQFLLVDGDPTPGYKKIWYAETTVQSGNTYHFSALVNNLANEPGTAPKCSLRIQVGNAFYVYAAQTIYGFQSNWRELRGVWPSCYDGTVELSIVMEGGGIIGRDLAIDNISFEKVTCAACTTEVRPCDAQANVGPDKFICPGADITIGSNLSDPGLTFEWKNGSGTVIATTATTLVAPSATTTYTLTVTDNTNNCYSVDHVTVGVVDPRVTIAANKTEICSGGYVQINYKNPVNVQSSGQQIFKNNTTDDWDAGFSSIEFLDGNGKVETEINALGQQTMFGLSSSANGISQNNIEYAILLKTDNTMEIYNSGTMVYNGYSTNYIAGDKISIRVDGSVIRYYHNTTQMHSHAYSNTARLYADVSMYSQNANLRDIRISSTQVVCRITSFTSVAGAQYEWYVNNVLEQSGTSTMFVHALPVTGDEIKCKLISICSGEHFSNVITITGTAPNVSVTADEEELCLGENTTLHLTAPAPQSGTLEYLWSPSTGLSDPAVAEPEATITATTTYTGMAIYTASDGTICTGTDDITLTYHAPPAFTVDAGDDVWTCVNSPVELEATVTPSGTYTYSWTPLTDITDANTSTPTVTTSVAQRTYTVSVSHTDTYGCTNEETDEVVVNTASVSATASVQSSTCNTHQLNVNVSASLSGTTTYQWSPSTELSNAAIANPIATITANRTYTVTVTHTANNGLICTTTSEVELTYHTPPSFTVDAGTDVWTCADYPVNLNATVTPSGTYTYSWVPQFDITGYNTSSPTVTTDFGNISYTVFVSQTDAHGCTTQKSDAVAINTVSDNFTLTKTESCTAAPGNPTKYNTRLERGVIPGASYQWQVLTGGVWAPVSPVVNTVFFDVTANGTYRLKVFINGCVVYSQSVAVTLTTMVDVTQITRSSNNVCPLRGVELEPTVTSGKTPYTYSWTHSGTGVVIITAPTSDNTFVRSEQTTTYTFTVTDNLGCTATMDKSVTVKTATVTLTGPNPACPGTNTYIASGFSGSSSSLNWNQYQSPTTGGYTIVSSPPDKRRYDITSGFPGMYLMVTDANGNCGYMNISGACPPPKEESDNASDNTGNTWNVTIYPNPSSGQINISVNKATSNTLSVEITDVNGAVVLQADNLAELSDRTIEVNWPAGMYYVKITDGHQIEYRKLIITK